MELIVCVGFVGFAGFILWKLLGAAFGPGFNSLSKTGLQARGILLQVESVAWPTIGGPLERRQVLVDVEIPGQPPYEVRANAFVPINLRRDVMPGATVELRVHPTKRNLIAIVGPGSGFMVTGLVASAPSGAKQ